MEMDHGFVGNFQVRHGRLRQPTKISSGQLLFDVLHDIEGVRTRAMWFGCNETAPSTLWFLQARMPDWTGALMCVLLSRSQGVRVLRVPSRSETSRLKSHILEEPAALWKAWSLYDLHNRQSVNRGR